MINSDRYLPNQPVLKSNYTDDKSYELRLYGLLEDVLQFEEIKEQTTITESQHFSSVALGTPPVCLSLYTVLFKLAKVKNVLEIGSFVGASSVQFGKLVGEDGKVITIEKFNEFADIAQKNIDDNCLKDVVSLLRGDALEVLDTLQKYQFDFVYIDGDKSSYWRLFEKVDPLVRSGGMIVVDDVFFNGDVLNDTCNTEKGKGCREMLDKIKGGEGYTKTIIPISNGILLLAKD